MELIQSKVMQNDERNSMKNIAIGDELWDRDTRRVGRKLKVLFLEKESVTAEVIADSTNAKKSTVGNNTDIARDRLNKGYVLHKKGDVSASTIRTKDILTEKIEVTAKGIAGVTINSEHIKSNMVHEPVIINGAEWREVNGFEPAADEEVVDDPFSLHDAINAAGYFWLPPVEDLLAAVAPDAPTTTKTGLVYLIHNIIRESLVTGQ